MTSKQHLLGPMGTKHLLGPMGTLMTAESLGHVSYDLSSHGYFTGLALTSRS